MRSAAPQSESELLDRARALAGYTLSELASTHTDFVAPKTMH
jgi:DNA mismatch repair protein MutH